MVEICTSLQIPLSNSGIWANFNFFGNCLSSTYHLQCTLLVPEDIETGFGGGGCLFFSVVTLYASLTHAFKQVHLRWLICLTKVEMNRWMMKMN